MSPEIGEQELEKFGERFIVSFEACRRTLTLYPPSHPKVSMQIQSFLNNLNGLHSRAGQAMVNVMKGEFFVNGKALKRLSITYRKNITAWEEMGIGLIQFDPDTSIESLLRFFQTIGRSKEELDASGGIMAALAQAGMKGIRASRVTASVSGGRTVSIEEVPVPETGPATLEEVRLRSQESLERLKGLAEQVRSSSHETLWMLRCFGEAIESRLLRRQAVRNLADRLRAHDLDSYQHALNGAIGSILIGSALGLEPGTLLRLGEAALLRDIGKILLSPEVLGSGAASEHVRIQQQMHPALGANLLLSMSGVDPTAAIVALEHHVGQNFSGYPRLRAKRSLHPFSRIVSVATDYDRMTGGYAGTPPLTAAGAVMKIAAEAGSIYDPAAVRGLMYVVGYIPEGTGVKLRDGRTGVVVGTGRATWLAPEVAVLYNASGTEVEVRIEETDALGPPGLMTVTGFWNPKESDIRRLDPFRSLA
jgi:HD-GYP domain-containing protein (c-di-GMP phosphodiesterase class II)